MKVSIITVSYNSAATISDTIHSVLSQDYPLIEYIIVDGLSTDGTPAIIESFGSKISLFISERDNGLYDAMNKAIDLSTGEIIGILNSDDIYADSRVLSRVVAEFVAKNVDSVFGDLFYFKSSAPDKVARLYKGKYFSRKTIKFGILPPHPTLFLKKVVYDKYGKFDLQFKYAADFDLMTRLFYVHNITFSYLPLLMVKMRLGGVSTGNLGRILKINQEDIRSCRKNGVRTNFFLFHLKYLLKVFHIKNWLSILRPR